MESASLKQELTAMESRLTEMEDKIDSIDNKLTQVVDAILGNPLTKQGGFIAEIKDLKQQIGFLKETIKDLEKKDAEHDAFKNRIIWASGGIIALFVIIKALSSIYANIIAQ